MIGHRKQWRVKMILTKFGFIEILDIWHFLTCIKAHRHTHTHEMQKQLNHNKDITIFFTGWNKISNNIRSQILPRKRFLNSNVNQFVLTFLFDHTARRREIPINWLSVFVYNCIRNINLWTPVHFIFQPKIIVKTI